MKRNNIPLELDARIYDIEDIETVITADEKDVGKMGYFANSIQLFKNLEGLDGVKYGKLMYLSDLDHGGDKSDKCFVCDNHWAYRYFISEDVLKPVEKQYRAYSLEEFYETFDVADLIIFRRQDSGNGTEEHSIYLGYETAPDLITDASGNGTVLIGNRRYNLQDLFDFYELKINDEWQPFGIEIQGDE